MKYKHIRHTIAFPIFFLYIFNLNLSSKHKKTSYPATNKVKMLSKEPSLHNSHESQENQPHNRIKVK